MNCKEFLKMYDNWNGIVCVNDNRLNLIIKDKPEIITSNKYVCNSKVLSFGFYDNELCVRVI